MKKNLIIALLTVVTICSVIFALFQTTEAKKQERLAIAIQELATQNEMKAIKEKEAADIARMEAVRQKELADECSRRKK